MKASSSPSAMVPEIWKVYQVHPENADTVTLELSPHTPKPFFPGQFNMLYAFGVGEIPISISGPPHEPVTLFHTIRRVGAVSRALSEMRPGQELGLRGPFGSVWPLEQARGKDVIIMAGGLGLAPVRPIVYEILRRRDDFERVTLLYGCRHPDEILFAPELHALRSRFDLDLEITVDRGSPSWHGPIGVITTLLKRLSPRLQTQADKTLAFVCGPEIMMRFSAQELLQAGLSEVQIYLSMERNMHCAIGLCGHCQFGPDFICKDGPIFRYDRIKSRLSLREV